MGFENGHLLRVSVRATRGSDQQVNTFHYDLINLPANPANDPQSLADAFRDDVLPVWATAYRPDWTLQPVEIIDEFDPQNPTDPRSSWTSGSPIPGTRATSGDLLPSFCVCVVTLRTSNIGRRFRGRTFLGGSNSEDNQSAGVWGIVPFFQGMIDAVPTQPDISGPGSDSTANLCVYSRTQRAANLDPYASHVVSKTANADVHSLRSRASYS